MFLHAGNNFNIRERDIIGIFDMDNSTTSPHTRKLLTGYQKRNAVISSAEEIPKSFILFSEKGKNKICFSPLSPASLGGRIGKI